MLQRGIFIYIISENEDYKQYLIRLQNTAFRGNVGKGEYARNISNVFYQATDGLHIGMLHIVT